MSRCRLLRESGSQVDDNQEFAVLDPEAFQHCEKDEPPIEEAKESSVAEASAVAHHEIPASVTAAQVRITEEAGTPKPSGIVEERQPTSPPITPITIDDLRRQQDQKPKRRSTSAISTEQMTLW
jgi:hypothetical protein